MKKKLIALLLAGAMVLNLAACGTKEPEKTETPAETQAQSGTAETAEPETTATATTTAPAAETPADTGEGGTVTVTDMSGDEVTVEGKVEKVINLWPSVTSSFFVMGAGDLLVGVGVNSPGIMNRWTQFFYPECVNIMSMGGTEPSVEELVTQNPDLVITHPSSASSGLAQQIRDTGIPAVNINYNDYETMAEAYTILGQILGGEYQEKLNQWCTDVQGKLEEHRSLTAGLSDDEKPVVYYIAGQSEELLTTMGAGSIMQTWIEVNGGIFASDVLNLEGQEVTAEEIFSLNPDVIIVGGVYQHVLIDQLKNTDGWKELNAVKNNRVYNNPYGCFNWERFGLESLMQIDYALLCIQPEIAAENGITRESMVQEVQDFYQYYNGTELTDEEAGYMLDGMQPDGTAEVPVQ